MAMAWVRLRALLACVNRAPFRVREAGCDAASARLTKWAGSAFKPRARLRIHEGRETLEHARVIVVEPFDVFRYKHMWVDQPAIDGRKR